MTPTEQAAGAPTVYVALGDSISIDEYAGGPGRGGASLLVRNLDDDFPEWRGRDLTSAGDTRLHLLASDGATRCTVLAEQLPRLAALGVAPTVVTLTVGGNDLLAAYGDTAVARAVIPQVTAAVAQTLDAVCRLMAPGGRVILGTVYDPSDGTGDSARLGLPPWPEGVEVLGELNAALMGAATEHGVRVADIHQRFLGHGVLAGYPSQPRPRPADRSLWYCNLIEPNAWGASEVRAAFWEALHQTP
ncbi:MAG TPA: SGNH/GDSL hydrolase family protein [Cryptosporangiaceae bacterium]|nr:SGNH/GDSL hydrolase family protein [Cryptosporangiaceae bacterium]